MTDHGVAACAGAAVALPLLAATAFRIESDLAVTESDDHGRVESRAPHAALSGTPSRRIAWHYLVRLRRDPNLLSHLSTGVAIWLSPLVLAATNHSLVPLAADVAVFAAVVVAGGAVCLNPLGADRDQLSLLLTSAQSGAALVRGRALAGLALAAPLVALSVPLGLIAYGPAVALARTAMAAALLPASAGVALGLGAAVPVFDPSAHGNEERVEPSLVPRFGHFVGSVVVGWIGLYQADGTATGAHAIQTTLVDWGTFLALVAVSGGLGYAYAVRKFDGLDLDAASLPK
ncbi:hypothetical protein [Halomicrobium salinisoli]|uniref:hypothetical protein n=1 Tax=Halomicrobium salinisoli TaxID=2878391 RepID=UPI001CF09330|nr:hypothetical protein [Halomicrobium salinisoli]